MRAEAKPESKPDAKAKPEPNGEAKAVPKAEAKNGLETVASAPKGAS